MRVWDKSLPRSTRSPADLARSPDFMRVRVEKIIGAESGRNRILEGKIFAPGELFITELAKLRLNELSSWVIMS